MVSYLFFIFNTAEVPSGSTFCTRPGRDGGAMPVSLSILWKMGGDE